MKSLDYKVANLKRKLNKLKFKRQEREAYLETMIQKRDKIKALIGERDGGDEFMDETKDRYLENEIHKTSLKMTEAEMVKKNYNIILDMLKKEKLSYKKQIEQMEFFEDGQLKEIEILEKDYEESMTFRDELRAEQKEWEDHFTKESKMRNMKIVETKRSMKEKKDIFNNLDTLLNKSDGPKQADDQASSTASARKEPSLWPSAAQVHPIRIYFCFTLNVFVNCFKGKRGWVFIFIRIQHIGLRRCIQQDGKICRSFGSFRGC